MKYNGATQIRGVILEISAINAKMKAAWMLSVSGTGAMERHWTCISPVISGMSCGLHFVDQLTIPLKAQTWCRQMNGGIGGNLLRQCSVYSSKDVLSFLSITHVWVTASLWAQFVRRGVYACLSFYVAVCSQTDRRTRCLWLLSPASKHHNMRSMNVNHKIVLYWFDANEK